MSIVSPDPRFFAHSVEPDDDANLFELADRTPLQALASAYADRLISIRAQADAQDLAESAALIANLERVCLRGDVRRLGDPDR